MANCRFCTNWRDQGMVKYGVRHYAHFKCYLENGKPLADLHGWQLGEFPYRLLREHGAVDAKCEWVDPVIRAKFEAAEVPMRRDVA